MISYPRLLENIMRPEASQDKATESPTLADASHVKLFLETYPQKARRGFIVCRCREPRRLAENIEAIPWWSL
jgi:hypothetical protein